VLAYETGVADVADPLGGSWYVEALTDRIEAEAESVFAYLESQAAQAVPDGRYPIGPMTSGILAGIESGWFTGKIADAASAYQAALEDGTKHVVGVTRNVETVTGRLEILKVSHEVEADQRTALATRRSARDDAAVRSALAVLRGATATDANLVEPMLAAARVEATLGEICGVLRDVWGSYREPARL